MRLLFIGPKTLHVYSFLTIPLLLIGATNSSQAASYAINPASTHIRFAIERFKSSATSGGFCNIKGQLQYDPNLKSGDILLIIPINSLNTGNLSFKKGCLRWRVHCYD